MAENTGVVYLIGAGPGDVGLFTLRGKQLLEQADVVVYDYLANPKLLSFCERAEKIYVGKKSTQHTMTQDEITQLLVDLGSQGKRVARLKGGDPYIFGRGGEEAAALKSAGIRFEVVPGITAAVAAANYAGIPITHRDFNSGFTLLTGHEKEDDRGEVAGAASDLDYEVLAKLPCIAFYMGVRSLPSICRRLIEKGLDPETPAATIQWGTTPRQRSVDATVATLAQEVARARISSPAITIIGKVVALRHTLNWFERRPLFGQTIVVTRTRQQASELSEQLEELGARVIEAPTIELKPAADPGEIDRAIRNVASYDWIVFTSANGVRFTRQRLNELNLDVRIFGSAKIAAIGESTAAAVRESLALRVDLSPERSVAEALSDALAERNELAGKKFLLLRADIARPILRERIVAAGGTADDIAIYQTVTAKSLPTEVLDALRNKEVNWITFASSSAVRNLVTLLGDEANLLRSIQRASIGPITTATMNEVQLPPTIEAKEFTIDGLVAALQSR